MSQQNNDSESGIALLLVSSLIAATVVGVVWFGAHTVLAKQPVAAVEVISSIPAGTVPEAAHSQPFVMESDTLARYYFTQDQAAVPADGQAQVALAKLIEQAKAGSVIVLTAFNGLSPATAAPEALVNDRIGLVRAQLMRLGVPAEKLALAGTQTDAQSQDWAHAQRIELQVQPAGAAANIAAVPQAEPQQANAGNDGPSVAVEDGVVKFYFGVGSDSLADGASEALLDVVAAVNSGKRAVISGFTDATGDAAVNEELSKKRAFAVRDKLLSLNIPEDKIELERPQSNTGTGSNAQARRVEVRIED
ncbi:OmpA family protein [Lampropedia aestuarii]|nr:OmpA family protein [Lampropedia aestuarii]MDH5858316.1 OmpA family protein [Lampropedia aestuarii]